MSLLYSTSGFTFNFDDNVISSSATSVTVQNLVNVIRDAESSPLGLEEEQIGNAGGKFNLGSGILTGISLELLNSWQLKFPDFPGPSFIQCFVTDGNLVGGISNNPIMPSSYTQVLQLGAVGGTIAQTTVSAGGSSAVVDNNAISQAVWSYPVSGSSISAGTIGQALTTIPSNVWTNSGTSVLNGIQVTGVTANVNYGQVANSVWGYPISSSAISAGSVGQALSATYQIQIGKWEMAGNQLKLYDVDGVTVLKTFDLFDSSNNPSLTGVVKRVPV